MNAATIFAGPHITSLVDTGERMPVAITEPLRFIPAPHRMAAPVNDPAPRDRIARCGECGYATDHPIARVCTHSLCPHIHGAASALQEDVSP